MEEQKDTCNTQAIKEEKQKQAIIYAIENYPLINRTKLMKYIFFIDLFTYNKTGDTLLEDCYIRLPNGPVPKYGFEQTDPKRTDVKEFSVEKIMTGEEGSIYYHYKFNLKPGVESNLKVFNPNEIDLLNLTLDTVSVKRTATLSRLTHTYDLWKNNKDGKIIDLDEFKLEDKKQLNELELFLNLKVYLSPVPSIFKKKGAGDTINGETQNFPIINGFPETLPVYINRLTGEFITR